MAKRFELAPTKTKETDLLLSMIELARYAGLHPELLERFFAFGLIDASVDKPEPLFELRMVSRVRKIQRLRDDLGLNLAGVGLALELIERIEALEKELWRYRQKRWD